MRMIFQKIIFTVMASLFAVSLQAQTPFQEIQKVPFDWARAWGNISLETDNDPLIPATRHAVKLSIKNTLKYCLANNASATDLKVFTTDINGDGEADYIIDTASLRGKTNADCPEALCTSEGCYVVAYMTGPASQIIEESQNAPTEAVEEKQSEKEDKNKDADKDKDADNDKSDKDETKNSEKEADKEKEEEKVSSSVLAACPASAELNKECRADCVATQTQCPHLFEYSFRVVYTKRVPSWGLHSAALFPPANRAVPSPYLKDGDNVVMSFAHPDIDCYGQELSFNSGTCNKFLQWNGEFDTGFLRDIFRLYTPPITADNDTRYTTVPFSRDHAKQYERGITMGVGTGIQLEKSTSAKSFFAIQLPRFNYGTPTGNSTGATESFLCFEVQNTGNEEFFIPTNTDIELRAFLNNPPAGVMVKSCTTRFTEWFGGPFMFGDAKTGVLDCGALAGLPCHSEQEIFAERYCERSTGSLTSCEECINGTQMPPIYDATDDNSDTFGRQTVDNNKPVTTAKPRKSKHLQSTPAVDETKEKVKKFRNSTTSYVYYEDLFNVIKQKDPALHEELLKFAAENKSSLIQGYTWYFKIYYSACLHSDADIVNACYNLIFGQRIKVVYEQTATCQRSALCHISTQCTHGASCLPPKVKILMADGSEKSIGDIVVGDMVMSFKAENVKGPLVAAKVKAIKITHDRPILSLNEIDLTPNHPVVLANGSIAIASEVGRNDQLLEKDGKEQSLRKIIRQSTNSTVFNLEIEDMDGFVANGIRVMDESVQEKLSKK